MGFRLSASWASAYNSFFFAEIARRSLAKREGGNIQIQEAPLKGVSIKARKALRFSINLLCFLGFRRCYNKCINREENQYLKTKPFTKNWSISMINQVDDLGSCILNGTGCNQCGEGPDMCTTSNDIFDAHTTEFQFWYDKCREKWFFLGPSKPVISNLLRDKTIKIHTGVEDLTKLMREEIAGKVEDISLFPRPIIVALGKTGVGKSTTGNALITGHARNKQCFSTGGGVKSKTKITSWNIGKWQGVGRCATIVDTPGTDDTAGPMQDYENIKDLMLVLKDDLQVIDVFLVMFKEENKRFEPSMEKALKIFVSIFGEGFWKNVVTEFTYWEFDSASMQHRYNDLCNHAKQNADCSFGDDEEEETSGYVDDGGWDPWARRRRSIGDEADPDNNEDEDTYAMEPDCKLLIGNPTENDPFYTRGSLDDDAWQELADLDISDTEDFFDNNCDYSSSGEEIMFRKADYVTRKSREIGWNGKYKDVFPGQIETKIPTVFVHPVYKKTDPRQCQRFKQETDRLWALAEGMEPFLCSEKCQAPDEFFLGKPQIFSINSARKGKQFSLTCTIWNGVQYSGLRKGDVVWFRGWNQLDLSVERIYDNILVDHDVKKSGVLTLQLFIEETIDSDVGLYTCALPGVRELDKVTFEEAHRVDLDMLREGRTSGTDIIANCDLKITKGEFDLKRDELVWYKADEINFEFDDNFQHEMTQAKEEYVTDKLVISAADVEHEGKYACKTAGGFSNQVDLSVDVDAAWADWADWSECSLTCGGGKRTRKRTCQSHKNDGKTCEEVEAEESAEMTESCNTVCCPEDGKWRMWESWGACSKSCSTEVQSAGTRKRKRTCSDPPPSGDPCPGKACEGDEEGTENCNSFEDAPCPIHGGWSDYGEWGDCVMKHEGSSGCSGFEHKRIRTCTNPPPQHDGNPCKGLREERQTCSDVECPIPCNCDNWPDDWTTCLTDTKKTCRECDSAQCEGKKKRRRVCTEAAHGGEACTARYGSNYTLETKTCTLLHCPVDGQWNDWGAWAACDKTTGRRTKRRTCREPKYLGQPCRGNSEHTENCAVGCNCDGVEWGEWSPCPVTCGAGIITRGRGCRGPQNGGSACTTAEIKQQKPCPGRTGSGLRRCPLEVRSEWSMWTSLGACSVNCGGGFQTKERSCEEPTRWPKVCGVEVDRDYDTIRPCSGEGLHRTADNTCNTKSCDLSMLMFLMDTTCSFSGVDQNSALTLATGLLDNLKSVKVPKFRLVSVNDPTVDIHSPLTDMGTFRNQLNNLYKRSHPSGGDAPGRALKVISFYCAYLLG